MNRLFDLAYWGRALTHPIVWLGLAIDLLPIYGVIAWGWNAVPLVMLYWIENIVAGAMTIPRIVISGASYGGFGVLAGLGMSAFFVFHYGLFCMVHGTFLMGFAAFSSGPQALSTMPFMDLAGMFQFSLATGLHVDWMLYAIIGFQVIVFLWEFIIKGEWKNSNPMAEMFAPYSRIIVLHFGLFVGAGALIVLGQPMIGVLALIVFRAIWGIITNAGRAGVPLGFESKWNEAVTKMSNREYFEKAMRGETVEDPNER
ncbi:MAG: DUF6498-containing protein [Hyphomonadaceae bacterium]|nr:DUF6498-containing protein [Hyphomonadaceae bacterium]